jgi:SHS2 domain-containing protein
MTTEPAPYRFEVRDHAADKAATAYGKTLNEVFEASAYAMFGLMFDLATVQPQQARRVVFAETSGEELLKRWLDDLLFTFDTEAMVFSAFAVEVECPPSPGQTCSRLEGFGGAARQGQEPVVPMPPASQPAPWRLTGVARGQRFSEAIERRGAAVKAVTYHNFSLRPPETPDGDWVAEMVFDV